MKAGCPRAEGTERELGPAGLCSHWDLGHEQDRQSPDRRHRGSEPSFQGQDSIGKVVQKASPEPPFEDTTMNSQLQSNREKQEERVQCTWWMSTWMSYTEEAPSR